MQTEKQAESNVQDRPVTRDFRTYARILLKYAPLIIGITVVTTGIALVYSLTAQEIYQVKVLLRIERENMKMFPTFDSVFYGGGRDFDYFQTQIKLFGSRSLIRATLNELSEEGKAYEPEGANSEEARVTAFLKKVTVRPEPRSQLVNLFVEDQNPNKAKLYANTLARMYIKEAVVGKMGKAQHYGKWFEDAQALQEEVVQKRDREFRKFKKKHNVGVLDIEFDAATDALKKLLEQLNTLNEQRIASADIGEAEAFMLEQTKVEIEDDIDQKKSRIAELNSLEIEYRFHQQRLKSARDQYTLLLSRAEEGSLMEREFDPRNIIIVDEAELPEKPVKPRKTVNVLFGMLFGIFLGVGIAFFVEYLDDTIKSPTDVETFLRVPFLGLIPAISKTQANAAIEGIVEHQPKGTVAENYRAIRTNILFSSDRPVRRLIVTSAGPSEGKTTTALNIAEVMARAGDRTLIIDGDMRRPRIHKLLELDPNAKGLSNFLVGSATEDEIVHKTAIDTLYIMPAGPIPPNPVELLNSPRLKELIEHVSEQFDRIIFDSPPVIAVTDAAILARLSDGVIFTVHGGHAHRDLVKRGIDGLRNVGGHVFGVILNNVNIYRASYYDYYYYNYYRYAYGYGYGYRKRADTKRKKPRKQKKKAAAEL